MKYKRVNYRHGLLIKSKYKQELEELRNVKKGRVREQINEKIFDPEDAIADNNKLIMLALTLFKKVIDVNFNIENLKEDDKALIDYFRDTMAKRETRFDSQFQEEKYRLIDKLFGRQEKVGEIIKKVYKEG